MQSWGKPGAPGGGKQAETAQVLWCMHMRRVESRAAGCCHETRDKIFKIVEDGVYLTTFIPPEAVPSALAAAGKNVR